MTSPIVTSSAFRVAVQIGPRTYTLRPPSFAEAGELASRVVAAVKPGPAMVAETIRQALEERLGGEAAPHVRAITDHEEAEDLVSSIILTRPEPTDPPSAHAEWRASMADAQRAMTRANRAREVAIAKVADHPAVVRIHASQLEQSLAERLLSVRICLLGWEGDGLPEWCPDKEGRIPETVLATLPANELGALAERCGELTRPSKAAEKN